VAHYKEFARWLEDPVKQQPILLDAGEAEYTVSHLKQSQRIDPNQPDLAAFEVFKGHAYRSLLLGWLSSARIAEQLGQAGFSRVYNLEAASSNGLTKDAQSAKMTAPHACAL